MTRRAEAVAALVAATMALSACSSMSTEPQPPATMPADTALAAYERYWLVTTEAFSAPASRDWTPEIEAVATGEALEAAVREVNDYASLPAHTEGTAIRSPTVISETPNRVQIKDCVDLGDSALIYDPTGQVMDDPESGPRRFTYYAEVIEMNGNWLVEQATPELAESC